MVRYSGSFVKRSNIGSVRKMTHEGKVSNLGCLMLAKNHPEVMVNNDLLDDDKSDYLVAL